MMFVRELGRGPTVLLLHGTPSPAADWLPVAERLAARYRVLVPDLPGYGSSPMGGDLADLGRDFHAIAGYSTGAYRALDLLLNRGVRAKKLALVAGMATFPDDARAMRRAVADELTAGYGARMRALMAELMLAAPVPAHVAEVQCWLSLIAPEDLATELRALADVADLTPRLGELRMPVYLRVGARDIGAPPAWTLAIAQHLCDARIDIVPGVGHALFVEDRRATVDALAEALS